MHSCAYFCLSICYPQCVTYKRKTASSKGTMQYAFHFFQTSILGEGEKKIKYMKQSASVAMS